MTRLSDQNPIPARTIRLKPTTNLLFPFSCWCDPLFAFARPIPPAAAVTNPTPAKATFFRILKSRYSLSIASATDREAPSGSDAVTSSAAKDGVESMNTVTDATRTALFVLSPNMATASEMHSSPRCGTSPYTGKRRSIGLTRVSRKPRSSIFGFDSSCKGLASQTCLCRKWTLDCTRIR